MKTIPGDVIDKAFSSTVMVRFHATTGATGKPDRAVRRAVDFIVRESVRSGLWGRVPDPATSSIGRLVRRSIGIEWSDPR